MITRVTYSRAKVISRVISVNPGIQPRCHFCDFFSKDGKFRFKTNILKFLGIQPT